MQPDNQATFWDYQASPFLIYRCWDLCYSLASSSQYRLSPLDWSSGLKYESSLDLA